jgi:hypothetical protein
MSGSSIAQPDAAPWVSDFLNAAYFARPRAERSLDELRLALAVLATRWHRTGKRLRITDLAAFNRAFGADRLRAAARMTGPVLDAAGLREGAERMHGPGFTSAYRDPGRRGWGIVFESPEALASYEPESRMNDAPLGELSPPLRPLAEQCWHNYRPVGLPSAGQTLELLSEPRRWPDFSSELGRFTSLRCGGLPGQTFEIEVAAATRTRTPVFTRAYVTVTAVLRGAALGRYVSEMAEAMSAAQVQGDRAPLPPGATPSALVELTTHEGHFLGRAISRLFLFEERDRAFIRDIGSWDPLPVHLALPYRVAGHAAQRAFWGERRPEESMLHQVARESATAG